MIVGCPELAQPASAVAATITVSPGHAFVNRRRAAEATSASGMAAVASSISRNARWSSAGVGRAVERGDESVSIVPDTKRSDRTASKRALRRRVSSSLRSVSSWSQGELSTATVRQPSTKLRAWARRAASAPTT